MSLERKPSKVRRYYWSRDGVGWELRKSVYVEENGVRKRKRRYLGHLSQRALRAMRQQYKGIAFKKAIAQWITEHDH